MSPDIYQGISEFQFTHPGKGATVSDYNRCLQSTSFNSRTLGRVRPMPLSTPTRLASFNSRTLGRVRLSLPSIQVVEEVSIHAPWEGCDRG